MRSLAVIWRAGGLLFSTDVGAVVEVLAPVAAEPMPGAPGWVRGLFAYRGRLIPLVDAAGLIARRHGTDGDRMLNRVLVVRSGDTKADLLVGLWVEAVLDLDRPEFEAGGSHPGLADGASRFLGPIAQTRFGAVRSVLPRELFTEEQTELLFARVKAGAA